MGHTRDMLQLMGPWELCSWGWLSARLNVMVTKWGRPYVLRTAELLPRASGSGRGACSESVWCELWTLLCIEGETSGPGESRRAEQRTQPLEMAGAIVRITMTDDQSGNARSRRGPTPPRSFGSWRPACPNVSG